MQLVAMGRGPIQIVTEKDIKMKRKEKCFILYVINVDIASESSEWGPRNVIKHHGDKQVAGVEGAEVGTVSNRVQISVDEPICRVVVHTRIAFISDGQVGI